MWNMMANDYSYRLPGMPTDFYWTLISNTFQLNTNQNDHTVYN